MNVMRRAVVLLSGGLDSATALAEAKAGRIRDLRADRPLRPAARRRDRGRPPGRPGAGSRPPRRARHRPPRLRRQRPDRTTSRSPRTDPTRRSRTESRSPTSRPGTRSSSRSPWPGPRRSALRHLHRGQLRRLLGLSRLPARVPAGVREPGQPGDPGRCGRPRPLPHPCPALDARQAADHPPRVGAGRGLLADAQLLRPDPRRPGVRAVRRLPDPPVGVRAARARGPDRLCDAGPDSRSCVASRGKQRPADATRSACRITSRPTRTAGRRAGFPFRSGCARRRGG